MHSCLSNVDGNTLALKKKIIITSKTILQHTNTTKEITIRHLSMHTIGIRQLKFKKSTNRIITSKSYEITNEGLNPADIAVGHFELG